MSGNCVRGVVSSVADWADGFGEKPPNKSLFGNSHLYSSSIYIIISNAED